MGRLVARDERAPAARRRGFRARRTAAGPSWCTLLGHRIAGEDLEGQVERGSLSEGEYLVSGGRFGGRRLRRVHSRKYEGACGRESVLPATDGAVVRMASESSRLAIGVTSTCCGVPAKANAGGASSVLATNLRW